MVALSLPQRQVPHPLPPPVRRDARFSDTPDGGPIPSSARMPSMAPPPPFAAPGAIYALPQGCPGAGDGASFQPCPPPPPAPST